MTDIEKKALALLNEVSREMGLGTVRKLEMDMTGERALLRAIEQHEAFRQEVSDAAVEYFGEHLVAEDGGEPLARFIIAKPVNPRRDRSGGGVLMTRSYAPSDDEKRVICQGEPQGRVNIRATTVGEFDLAVSVWLIDPEDEDEEIDAIFDTDTVAEAERWCVRNRYEIVKKPGGSL